MQLSVRAFWFSSETETPQLSFKTIKTRASVTLDPESKQLGALPSTHRQYRVGSVWNWLKQNVEGFTLTAKNVWLCDKDGVKKKDQALWPLEFACIDSAMFERESNGEMVLCLLFE